MATIAEAARAFLAHQRIAVTGVSRRPQGHGSNAVFTRLHERGFAVFPVNPNTPMVEGHPCYPNLAAIPGGVGAVVIGTAPEAAEATMRECVALGIRHVWMHRSFGRGSVSWAAVEFGRRNGLTVIAGGCPLMFDPAADLGHKVARFVCALAGTVPATV